MNWLFDTNVISESRRARPAASVVNWIAPVRLSQSYTSVVVLAELVYGGARVDDILKRVDIQSWIDRLVRPWFDGRTLGIDEAVLMRWHILRREREAQKQPSPAVDLLIAATAIENDLGVVTRDVTPFVGCGLPVLNPWTGERFNGA